MTHVRRPAITARTELGPVGTSTSAVIAASGRSVSWFLNDVVNFLIVAFVIFVIVLLIGRRAQEEPPDDCAVVTLSRFAAR
jgi:large-conductance mechanosensitive channel